MTTFDYGEYLASREWALLKEQVRLRSRGICERCQKAPYQETHHLTYGRIGHERLEDLQAVCSPCHRFVSAKSDYDPSVERVYLAGKISKNGWRHKLFPGLRANDSASPEPSESRWQPVLVRDGFEYCGPYFISCDHGCMHGEGSHGVAAAQLYETAGHADACVPSQPHIINMCKEWMQASSIVFCWMDSPTAYGTLVELGWAAMLGKPVAIFFKNYRLEHAMWFATNLAEFCGHQETVEEAWEMFVKWRKVSLRMKAEASR